MLWEGDQVKSTDTIRPEFFEGGSDVPKDTRGVVVDDTPHLLSDDVSVTFDRAIGPQTVREVPRKKVQRHNPLLHYRPSPPSSGDPGGELMVALVAVVAVIAAIFAAGVFIAGTLWAPLVGLETGWPDGSVTGAYFAATVCLIALGVGIWALTKLRHPSRSQNRRRARIAIGSTLVLGSLVALFAVLPGEVRSELRRQADRSVAAGPDTSSGSGRTFPSGGGGGGSSQDDDSDTDETPGAGGADTPTPGTPRFDEWPAGKEAFTLQLASTTSLAEAKKAAQEASGLGARILYSSHFPKLPTGYYVVYSGFFDTREAAESALGPALALHSDAFVRWVSPGGNDAPTSAEGPPQPSPAEEPPVSYDAQDLAAFSVETPAGWEQAEDAERHGPFERSRWESKGDPQAAILVDYAPDYRLSPEEAAERARTKFRQTSTAPYSEDTFEPTTMNGVDAWKWIYTTGDIQRAHYFVAACNSAYAVRGEVASDSFQALEKVFSHVADSLVAHCTVE